MTVRLIACLLLAAPLLGGCLSDRTFGESLDDSSAATEIKTRLFGAGGFGRFGEVDVAVVDKFVLLSGRVPTDADRKDAERIAWQVASDRRSRQRTPDREVGSRSRHERQLDH
jgi:osmotically-inducible protein OsmY